MPSLRARRSTLSAERALPIGVAVIVFLASVVSLPAQPTAVGGTSGAGEAPRIAVGGGGGLALGAIDAGRLGFRPILVEESGEAERTGGRPIVAPGPIDVIPEELLARTSAVDVETLSGPYLADGTVVMGFAPDTTVEDGKAKFRRYRVRDGDTLTGIARRFDISMMTLWWANDLKAKDDLHIGQWLTIPPASGLVITVGAGDTLESLSARHGVDRQAVLEVNGLTDPNLVVGQTLLMPGAIGKGIPTPKPTARPAAASRSTSGGGRSGGSASSVRPPTRYTGGRLYWPVLGGGNYISQYFRYGHYGIDIAADYGSRVRAAAGGRVIFAGWKSNGGGYQVWIAHGSNLYTTYNHMSGVSVGRGQVVGKGQTVGRIGCSGWCTGPHLHFEVWKGPIWNGGRRVNPLSWM